MEAQSTVRLFSCRICEEHLEDAPFATICCGFVAHLDCLMKYLEPLSFPKVCPNCLHHTLDASTIMKLYPAVSGIYEVRTHEEMDLLHSQLNSVKMSNITYQSKVKDLESELITSEDNLKQSEIVFKEINDRYSKRLEAIKNQKKEAYKFNEQLSKRILLQKELYESQAIYSAEFNKLKSEIEKLKAEKASRSHDYEQPSTSSKNATRKNALSPRIQSHKLQLSSNLFLSNCVFWFADEVRKVLPNHLYFNEHRVVEHGGIVRYFYTNVVTHVIGTYQYNLEVQKGLDEHKICVTDFWLSDVIAEKKLIKPWLAHHFPIPYSEDNLPYQHKCIAIVNFDKHEYQKLKSMIELTGATVINKISRSIYIVISMKLEGDMIKKALALKIPVVNVQWINDILLGEKIDLQHSKRKKYQNFKLQNPFQMNYNKVSHLMEAWDESPKVREIKLPSIKINKPTMTSKSIKTCVIQEFLTSGDNNGDHNNVTSITSTLAIPMDQQCMSSK